MTRHHSKVYTTDYTRFVAHFWDDWRKVRPRRWARAIFRLRVKPSSASSWLL